MTMQRATVKWFNKSKHFGFVTLPGEDEAFIHEATLGEIPLEVLYQGCPVEVEVETTKKGLAVTAIQLVGDAAIRAKVRWYDTDKGYGFLIQEGSPDIFIHASVVKMSGIGVLVEDQEVLVFVIPGSKGPKAALLRRANGNGSV